MMIGLNGMTPIFEEPSSYSTRHHIVESMYGTVRRIKKHHSHQRQSIANNLFNHDETGPLLTLRRNSAVELGCTSENNKSTGIPDGFSAQESSEALVGHFERSASTKSNNVKPRGPLSRLWHMRRRSFSQFELSSIGLNQGSKGTLGGSSGHLNLLDLNECDTPGVFHPIGDFWGSSSEMEPTTERQVIHSILHIFSVNNERTTNTYL